MALAVENMKRYQLEEEKHERTRAEADRDPRTEKVSSHQPRCGCSFASTRLVVHTCPECIAPVLAKMKVVINGS